jgi:hypothetical protein
MDTRSGEIFQRDTAGSLVPDGYATRREYERAQERMQRAEDDGYLVPVSGQVARQQKIGQRVEDRRRKRKAAKAARRRNR